MITSRDPAGMTAEERISEIAAILAKGYLRLLDPRESCPNVPDPAQKLLAAPGESTAACDPGSQSPRTKEVA